MDRNQFRAAAHAVIDDIIAYFDSLPNQRVLPTIQPGYLRPQIPEDPPVEPEGWLQIQADIESKIKPGLTHWQSPNFMAFFPAGVTYPSILGEMYSAAFTAPGFNWLCSPACTELETIIMDWLAKALALPECFLSTSRTHGGGVIQNSSSDSIVTMMVSARERCARERALSEGLREGTVEFEDRTMDLKSKFVALGSDQAHSSTAKGARVVGLRYRNVPTYLEDNLEMTGDALRKVLQQCEMDGLIPCYITLNMGTTNTCAVDRFVEVGAVLNEKPSWRRIWVHVDAAYAGSSLIVEECQHMARAMTDVVDSLNINMAKWLLVNLDSSLLFIRNRFELTNALDITPPYLRNPYSELGRVIDYRNWGIPLGRRFRSLKIWFTMRSYGLSGLKDYIRRTMRLGVIFADLVRGREDLFEIVTKPAFGLTVFRIRNPERLVDADATLGDLPITVKPDEISDSLTRTVYETINEQGEIYITSTVIAGIYVIRVVSTNEAAEEKYIRRAFDILVQTTESALQDRKASKL